MATAVFFDSFMGFHTAETQPLTATVLTAYFSCFNLTPSQVIVTDSDDLLGVMSIIINIGSFIMQAPGT